MLYFGANTVWKTLNGGQSWQQISPDLTRKTWDVPPSVGKYEGKVKVTQRGVVYALRSIAARYQPHLGGNGRRLVACDNRWRSALDKRLAAAVERLGQGFDHRRRVILIRTQRTRQSTHSAWMTCGRTYYAHMTAGRRGPKS